MIVEIAHLKTRRDAADAVREYLPRFSESLTTAVGCVWHTLTADLDDPNRFTLLVGWRTLEDHVAYGESVIGHLMGEELTALLKEPPLVVHVKELAPWLLPTPS